MIRRCNAFPSCKQSNSDIHACMQRKHISAFRQPQQLLVAVRKLSGDAFLVGLLEFRSFTSKFHDLTSHVGQCTASSRRCARRLADTHGPWCDSL